MKKKKIDEAEIKASIGILYSFDAEEAVLGYLFNPFIPEKERNAALTLDLNLFYSKRNRTIFSALKFFRQFDKIVLWERVKADNIKHENFRDIDWLDLKEVPESTTVEEYESYRRILTDKAQKRTVYFQAEEVIQSILEGNDQLVVALNAALTFGDISTNSQIKTNQELLENVLNQAEDYVIDTGYDAINKFIGGFTRGNIQIIAGDSGHLKTTLALDQALRIATRNPTFKVGVFSKEMLSEELIQKWLSRELQLPMSKIIRKEYDPEDAKRIMNSLDIFKNNRIKFISPDSFRGVSDIIKMQMAERFDVWYLDYLQLLEFAKAAGTGSDYNVQIAENMKALKQLAVASRSCGILLSQVKKGVELRSIKKPSISDIEWSGLIKQLAQYIFFSYYPCKYYPGDFETDRYYLLGEKTRFASLFTYPLSINPEIGLFQEIHSHEVRLEWVEELHRIEKRKSSPRDITMEEIQI
jgi:replicative DNA helicase